MAGKIADTLNEIIELNQEMAQELERVSRRSARKAGSPSAPTCTAPAGSWAASVDSVNTLIGDLVQPTSEVARVHRRGGQGRPVADDGARDRGPAARGRVPAHGKTVNTMVDQLGSFASEVTRVAREVGTEGKLGGQAKVKGVAGTWKDLTDNVNSMAGNLTARCATSPR